MTNNEPNVKLTIGSITQLTEHGVEQTTDAFGEITKRFVKVQAQHMDAALRAELIELGWTPPGGIALNAPGVDAQAELPFAWYLRTGHGNAIHFGTEPPDCLLSHEWKPVYERPAPTGVYAADEVEYEYEVWQSDAWQAGGSCTDLDTARNEASHYALMYGQDGPVTVKLYEKREITAALAALAEGEKGNG